MKRKITSLLLALVMTLALAVPAFATSYYWEVPDTGSTDLTQSLTFAATTKVPTISLKMPVVGTNPVILNPYQIAYTGEVTLNGVDGGAGNATDQTKQIISPVYAIQNESDVPLKVTVKASSTVAGEFKFATATVAATEKNKSAFVQVKFDVVNSAATPAGLIATGSEQTIASPIDGTTLTLKAGDVSFATGTSISLPCPTVSNNTVQPNFLRFQFTGDAAKEPTSGWTADDKFTTVLAFTFLPGGNTISNGNQQQAAALSADLSSVTGTSDTQAIAVTSWDISDHANIEIGVTLPASADNVAIKSVASSTTANKGDYDSNSADVDVTYASNKITISGTSLAAASGMAAGSNKTIKFTVSWDVSGTAASSEFTVTLGTITA